MRSCRYCGDSSGKEMFCSKECRRDSMIFTKDKHKKNRLKWIEEIKNEKNQETKSATFFV